MWQLWLAVALATWYNYSNQTETMMINSLGYKLKPNYNIGVIRMDKKDLSIIGDNEYIKMLEKIKKSYRVRQLKAAVFVNSEMLRFYYSLGEEIVSLKAESRWGSGFFKKLFQIF